MLNELSIKDFAIIESLQVNFKNGLTVLTGETGAGKSIIIDAIQLLSGGRGSVEYIRYGSSKATLEALFSIDSKKHPVYKIAEQYGIEIEDQMVVLTRTISQSGKSVCRVNGVLVTLAILREFGRVLIDIHTQHETQSLMDQDRHIELLDLYAIDVITPVFEEYTDLFKQLKKVSQRMNKLKTNEQEMIQRLDLLKFQLSELQEADLIPGEDLQLKEDRDKLGNAEKIHQHVTQAYDALNGEQRANDWLTETLSALDIASQFDKSLIETKDMFSEAYYIIEDVTHQLRDYSMSFDFNPDQLNSLESRLNEIYRLMRKYGTSVDDMLEYQASIADEIDQIENRDHSIEKLKQEVETIFEDLILEARQLHDLRQKAAKTLEKEIKKELKDLYLEKAQFEVAIKKSLDQQADTIQSRIKALNDKGMDTVEFMLSTNPGEPIKPLNKVASGGELSRIMLALKKIFAKHQGLTSVIFDEVDTGVSGRVAQAIAEKIGSIASGSQVLCITHLPQVAAMSDTHLLIEKQVKQERTYTVVRELESESRSDELARMMTGKEMTETSQEHAKALIQEANDFKKSLS